MNKIRKFLIDLLIGKSSYMKNITIKRATIIVNDSAKISECIVGNDVVFLNHKKKTIALWRLK